MFDWSVYRCVKCHNRGLEPNGSEAASCSKCAQTFTIRHNILDSLVAPSPGVIKEMQGTAREQGLPIEKWEDMKVRLAEEIKGIEDKLQLTQNDPGQYYQQTTMNFNQALDTIRPWFQGLQKPKVLEVGAGGDYYFLKPFKELGANCFGANIVFYYTPNDPYLNWPEKVNADMNDLPYADGTFDVVVMSATSHHSPNLEKTINELSRVTKKGGAVLMINDPIKGLLKNMGGCTEHDRDELIHENEFTIWRYHRAFTKSGFRPEYLFSKFHDQKLLTMKIHPKTRFATIAKVVSKGWQNDGFRSLAQQYLLWPAQAIFGFPLNVILWKI